MFFFGPGDEGLQFHHFIIHMREQKRSQHNHLEHLISICTFRHFANTSDQVVRLELNFNLQTSEQLLLLLIHRTETCPHLSACGSDLSLSTVTLIQSHIVPQEVSLTPCADSG